LLSLAQAVGSMSVVLTGFGRPGSL
jgi:hypothetical protein